MADRTPTTPIRVPRSMWAAYGRVCARLGRDRTEDLLAHMRAQIEQHGDDTDRADLAAADAELSERRARRGGRPRKNRPDQVHAAGHIEGTSYREGTENDGM